MIKLTDVRVGNLIMRENQNGYPNYETVRVIDSMTPQHLVAIQRGAVHYYPIPITIEIIEKSGFYMEDGLYHAPDNFYWLTIFHDIDFQLSEVHNSRKIEFLHDLQNLFYALTGVELPVQYGIPVSTK